MAARDEYDGCQCVPCQHQMVGGFGRQRKVRNVACAVAVGDADRGGGADRQHDHEGAVAERRGDLVRADGHLVEPSHHDARADKGRSLEEHLQRDGNPHAQQSSDALLREVRQAEAFEVDFVARAAEVADHQDRHQDAREQRAEAGTLGAHRLEPEAAVDEYPVETHVGEVGQDGDHHFDLRVADPFQELFEGEKEHDGSHAVSQHPVVGDRLSDHFRGLSEVMH